jgi:type IV secretory pathway component VirB8
MADLKTSPDKTDSTVLYAALPELRQAAKEEYEYYGSTLTTNAYLRVALLVAMAVIALLGFDHRSMTKKLAERKPYVVYINPQTGQAVAAPDDTMAYKPNVRNPVEMKYFLIQFTTKFFGRNHKTVQRDYLDSLYFLDSQTAAAVNTADAKTMWMPKFLHSSDDDIDIVVNNVAIEEPEGDIYRARVEFTRVYSNTTGLETKRENSIATYQFRFLPSVPNALIPYNPLGLSISYFREDKAFK